MAIVVRVRPFGETSQVVHLATPDHGLIAALVKGAHRPGPEFQGGLALATAGTAQLVRRPRAELELLRRYRIEEDLRGLRDDLPRFYGACHVVSLLRLWMQPHLPAPALFAAALTALRAQAAAPCSDLAGWTVWFEARALAATGHRPSLEVCSACGRALSGDGRARFSAPAGGLVHDACAPPGPAILLTAAERAGLLRLYTARLPELKREPPDDTAVKAARAVHDLFLPHVLERRPASLDRLPGRAEKRIP
ncbi:MAG: DNA repair protein RecO [Planctomycetota bacterium]|nr:DNA repair protein RecO [Planctomycetota bacterium]